MLITRYFVFVHVPKTGGTWVRSVIPDEWRVCEFNAHRERCTVPARYADLPVFAFVRNPWDWYVSFWEDRRRGRPEDKWVDELLKTHEGFEPFLRAALHSRELPYRVGRWMRDHDLDLYTAMFRDITSPPAGVWFGRYENLRRDLLTFLDEVAPVGADLRNRIIQAPPENVGIGREYRSYYTAELRDLVAKRSKAIIRQFGYEFEGMAEPSLPAA